MTAVHIILLPFDGMLFSGTFSPCYVSPLSTLCWKEHVDCLGTNNIFSKIKSATYAFTTQMDGTFHKWGDEAEEIVLLGPYRLAIDWTRAHRTRFSQNIARCCSLQSAWPSWKSLFKPECQPLWIQPPNVVVCCWSTSSARRAFCCWLAPNVDKMLLGKFSG